MHGLMQSWPLTVDKILDRAKTWSASREVVTRSLEGPIVRSTYADIHTRAKKFSAALLAMGIKPGDRVATLAWNTGRHLEVWYGVMGIGAVCHTVNPRLFADQICYIINHAQDRVVIADATFAPFLMQHKDKLPSVERFVILADEDRAGDHPGMIAYETLIAQHAPDAQWGAFDENTAAGLCYTSGTTGDPKGVLYSHRSNVLHTYMTLQADGFGLTQSDTVLPVVPMYHANAWGIAFSAPAVGAKLVMPGAKMDGASIHELLETEGVTFSAAVPTVWQGLLQHLRATKSPLTSLKRVVIGGAACPPALIRAFHDEFGVEVMHAWGMTEMSPTGVFCSMPLELKDASFEDQLPIRAKQGRPLYGVDITLEDDEGQPLPHDGVTFGHLLVRGPSVVEGYYRQAGKVVDERGFFDTGDIATIDHNGMVQITDRAKDVIKSGGEWISSVELENHGVGHAAAEIVAVIGVAHPTWDERPLMIVKLRPGESATREDFLAHMQDKVAKWWLPNDVVFVDDIPLGATGKIDKKALRDQFKDYRFPDCR